MERGEGQLDSKITYFCLMDGLEMARNARVKEGLLLPMTPTILLC